MRVISAFAALLIATTCLAQPSAPTRPLIFIPGVMGSLLCERPADAEKHPGSVVWGDRYSYSPARIERLRLAPDASNAAELVPCGVIMKVNIIPLVYTESIYSYAADSFKDIGYKENSDLFYFSYDWRLSNTVNAATLGDFIDGVLAKTGAKQVDIVAHSMGGLVAARYVTTHPNDAKVAKLVTVATPFWGSALIFERLWSGVSGFPDQTLGLGPAIRKTMLSFPSTFELLPSYERCCWFEDAAQPFDPFDPAMMGRLGWLLDALPGSEKDRPGVLAKDLAAARDSAAMARAFVDKYRDGGEAMLFAYAAASNFDTLSRITFDAGGAATKPVSRAGDGVVLLASAAAAVPARPTQFGDEQHHVMFRSQAIRNWLDNVLIENRVLTGLVSEPTAITAEGVLTTIETMGVKTTPNLVPPAGEVVVNFEVAAKEPIAAAGLQGERLTVFDEAGASVLSPKFAPAPSPTDVHVRLYSATFAAPADPGAYRTVLEANGGLSVEDWFMVTDAK